MRHRLLVLSVLFVLFRLATLRAAEVRYDDVVYLDDSHELTLHLKVLHRTPINFSRDPQSLNAYLAEGQTVDVIGLGETQYYVSARTATGLTQGWVDAHFIEAPPAALLAKLREHREEAQTRRKLIDQHEVAVGMSRADVRASLGKPDRTARVHTRQGDQEQWLYTTYQYVPMYTQYNDDLGRQRHAVSYHRQASGQKTVMFQNDQVTEIVDKQEEKPPLPSSPKN
jgi:hypothetical protein